MRELCPESGFGAAFSEIPPTFPDDVCLTIPPRVLDNSGRWYALHVRHRHEIRVGGLLDRLGWETLVPLFRSKRQWSDRVKDIDLPLFAGYVFCRFTMNERVRVEDTPGVVQIVKFNGQAAAVDEQEIGEIRRMLLAKVPLQPWPYLKVGDRVRVERGPLRGLEGTLLRGEGGARLVVGVELLQRSIAVEVDPENVVPVRARAAHA